jgi:F-type H+-transporting ATPase subunit a
VFRRTLFALFLILSVCLESTAFAGGGIVNWYAEGYALFSGDGFDAHVLEKIVPICGSLFTLLVLTLLGLKFRSDLAKSEVAPDARFSLRTMIELAMELVCGIAKDNIGSHWRTYAPLLAAIFMFILVSNLGGLVPGFIPATENINTNLAMGLTVFFIYNFAGLREHGAHYLKQFTGPMLAIAPLMLTIELISHVARPASLSLRLMGNIFADHLMLGIFTSTAPYILVPSALMFFGLLVSVVQSFVFTLLTSIYISMAVSHDH